MSSRRAGSVLLHHLGPRVFGPRAPLPLALSGSGGGQGAWVRLLSISASEARADVAEVYASNEDYASTKERAATIAASEARADVAEVYASTVDHYANIVEVRSAVAEEASKPRSADWKAKKPAFLGSEANKAEEAVGSKSNLLTFEAEKAEVAISALVAKKAAGVHPEAHASKENAGSVAAANAEVAEAARDGELKKPAESSYWGIAPSRLVNKDGVEWKWSCFRPWETYTADTTIDLTRHHEPKKLLDKIAYWTVKSLRWPTDIFFQVNFFMSILQGNGAEE
ncbi:hypothetical protein PR202_ga02407 [Eleusine coracana subsp. coracana]|uniref:ubiquinol oxidase (non-electrogenic) n=1 Tax=Eleusine coracana subsp. coracana TaxID=191504 RepID=A0AAV5BLA0_ELECO|nr:hypothetical protein PR202_ga02407 [Eleusine coracana subsp. coracana]